MDFCPLSGRLQLHPDRFWWNLFLCCQTLWTIESQFGSCNLSKGAMEKNKLFLKRFLFIFQDLCVCNLQNMTLGNLDAIIYQGTKSFGFKNTSPKILLIIRPILTGKVCKPVISWKLLDRFEGVDWLWTNRISSVETKFCDTYSF